MKRSRRAALALVCGSGSLLAVDTLGYSASRVDRDVAVDVTGDADGYLGLTEAGIEDGGLLFEGDDVRRAPRTFDVYNQLPEPIAVTLESTAFSFDPVEDGRLLTDDPGNRLQPGAAVRNVAVYLAADAAGVVRGTIAITAEGASTSVEADRDLALEAAASGVTVELCRGRSGNCVTVSIDLERRGGARGVSATVTVQPPDADPTVTRDQLVRGQSRTFEHAFAAYGSGRSGNWTVTSTTPDPRNPEAIGMPGRSVRFELDGVAVVVDPDATGPHSAVSTTVSVHE